MKKAIKLREEWESLRILLDVVRQREKRKLALLKLQQEVFSSPLVFQIVEEEVAVGWRIVQKTRISVAAKWKVRPIKLEAVRAHHNFRSSSGRYRSLAQRSILFFYGISVKVIKRKKTKILHVIVAPLPS
jgi:hypothetical protein